MISKTSSLTTSANVLTGGSGNDSFSGTAGTIDGDNLTGGDGTDTLNLTVTSAADDNSAFTASGIETISLRSTGGTANDAAYIDLEMGDVTGLTNLEFRRINDDIQIANLNSLDTTITMSNNATAADVIIGYQASAIAGTSDTANVTVDTTTGGADLTVNGVETLALTVTGSGNDLNIDGSTLNTVTVAGSGGLNMDVDASVTTLDASASTGGVRANFTAAAAVAATGGTGADTFSMGTTLAATDVINGGDGADTLIVTNAAGTDLAVLPASAQISNVETLRIEAVNEADADEFTLVANRGSFETITIDVSDASDTYTITNYTDQTLNIIESANNAIALINVSLLDATGTSDSLTLNVTNNDATTAFTVTDINSTGGGIETLNLVANQGRNITGSDIVFADVSSTHSSGVNISGNADVTIGSGTSFANTRLTTTALTGNLTATIGAATSIITLGNGTNSVTFADAAYTSADRVTGGTGTDTVVTGNLAAGIANATLTGVEVVYANFGTASAGLNLGNSTGVTTLNLRGDEAHVVSGIDGLSTINVASIDAAAADTVGLTFDTGNSQALTLTIGDVVDGTAGDDVDIGALTLTTYAGALTLRSAGATGNTVDGVNANTATGLAVSTVRDLGVTGGGDEDISAIAATNVSITTAGGAFTLDDDLIVTAATAIALNATLGNLTISGDVNSNVGGTDGVTDVTLTATDNYTLLIDTDLDVDHMRNVTMNATDGGDIDVDGVQLAGTDSDGSNITVALTLTTDDQNSTINFDTGANSGAAVIDLITVVSGAGSTTGVTETTITNADTDVTISTINASASAGDLVITLTTSDDAVSITTGSGNATITGTTAADTITLGSGTNTVRTQDGTDVITAGSGTDTIIAETINDAVVVNSFSSSDVIGIDLSVVNTNAAVENLINGAGATDVAEYFGAVIQSDADGTVTLDAGTNILRITNVMANNAAVLAAIDKNITFAGDIATANDSIMVLWTNGSSTFLSVAVTDDIGGAGDAAADVPGFDAVNDMIEFVGTTITSLTAANFDFVA